MPPEAEMTVLNSALDAFFGHNGWRYWDKDKVDSLRRSMQAAIAAAPGAEGDWVLVPHVATQAMISAGESAASVGLSKPTDDEALPRVWSAMLAAAPRTSDAVGVTREEIEQIIRRETYATITESVGGIRLAAMAILDLLHGHKEG